MSHFLTTLVVVLSLLVMLTCGQTWQGLRGGRRHPQLDAARLQREAEISRRREAQRRLEEMAPTEGRERAPPPTVPSGDDDLSGPDEGPDANSPAPRIPAAPSEGTPQSLDERSSRQRSEDFEDVEDAGATAAPGNPPGQEDAEAKSSQADAPSTRDIPGVTGDPSPEVVGSAANVPPEGGAGTTDGSREGVGHQLLHSTVDSPSAQAKEEPMSAPEHQSPKVEQPSTVMGEPVEQLVEISTAHSTEGANPSPATGAQPEPSGPTGAPSEPPAAPSSVVQPESSGPVSSPSDPLPATGAQLESSSPVGSPSEPLPPSSAQPKSSNPVGDTGSVNLRPSLEELVEEQRAITRVVLAQKKLVEQKLQDAEAELAELRRAQSEWSNERETLHTSVETVRNTLLAEKEELAKNVEELQEKLRAKELKLSEAEEALKVRPTLAATPSPSPPPPSPSPSAVDEGVVLVEATKRGRRTAPLVQESENRQETQLERMAREAGMTVEQYQYNQATGRAESTVSELSRTVDNVVRTYESSYDKAPEAAKRVEVPPHALDRLSKLEFALNQLHHRVNEMESTCTQAFTDTQKKLQLEKERAEAAESMRAQLNDHKKLVTAEARAQEEENKRVEAELKRAKREFEEQVRAREEEEKRKAEAAQREKERAQENEQRRLNKWEERLDESKRRELRNLEAIRRAESADQGDERVGPSSDIPWALIIVAGAGAAAVLAVVLFFLLRGSKKDHSRNFSTMSYEQMKKSEAPPVATHYAHAAPSAAFTAPSRVGVAPPPPAAGFQEASVIRGGPQPMAEGELRNRVLHWERNSNV